MPSLRGDGIFYGILQRMRLTVNTYCGGTSPVHACDARVKIVLLAAYSVTLFLVRTWVGLAIAALAFALVLKASGIPPRRVFGLVVPVYVLVAFTVAFNSFSLDVGQASAQLGGLADVSAGVLAEAAPVPLVGAFGFVPAGFARGCFFAIRILLLVFGAGSVLWNNRTDLSSISQAEWIALVVCLLLAAVLLLWNQLAALLHKKETAEKIPQGVHTMTFTLPATGLKVGQQLYLRPYMGEQQEQIAVTDEQGQPFGFIPAEHTDYVLSRIESHSMTHMTVTQIDEDGTQIQFIG